MYTRIHICTQCYAVERADQVYEQCGKVVDRLERSPCNSKCTGFEPYPRQWVCGAWWLSDRCIALRLEDGRFGSHSGRHVGTLGTPFTHSCL